MITRSQSGIVKPIDCLSLHTSPISHILKNPSHALKDPNWHNAMYDEYNALVKNGTWLLVPRPVGVNMRFAGYTTRAGFYHSRCDSSLFIYRQGSYVAYLLIYVDDIILTASCPALLQQIIGSLNNEFDMTDLGALNYFLGNFVDRTSTGLFLSHKKYALQLIERAHMVTCNPSRTPIDIEFKLGLEGAPVQDPTLYRNLEGEALVSYFYTSRFVLCSLADFPYAVQHIFLYMHDPRELYLAALKRILRYVPSTFDLCLHLYANCMVRNLFRELHSPLLTATLIYCDNVSAVYMSVNLVQHQRTKHIEIDIHFVGDMVTAGQSEPFNRVWGNSSQEKGFFRVDGVPALYATVLKFSSSAPFETIQPCRIPYLLGEPTNIPSSESQIDSLDIVHVGDGHGGEKEEEGEEKESFKALVLIELQPREPTRGLIDVKIEANAENGQIICGHLQSVTVGIKNVFLKAIVLNDIHDNDVAQYYMELFNDLWKACSSSSSTRRETFPLKGGKGVAVVNGTRYVKFLEVPAASLVQAIEKNLSAFVVNVIGDSLVNIVKDGGIISDIIWSDDVVGSGLDVVAHYKKK
uniref:AP-5 complex subunit beta-1 n=1 Tax=Tanacetum cinerariifolium TaxID=118510 RepID=A0A6L2KCV8_TANCI|nr:AP-5 complex subunit beta-1 [Tanacetum cinerariifolium]